MREGSSLTLYSYSWFKPVLERMNIFLTLVWGGHHQYHDDNEQGCHCVSHQPDGQENKGKYNAWNH